MNQEQQPKATNQCGQKQGCCCGSSVCLCEIVKGILLIVFGLFIAVPSFGCCIGIVPGNLFTRYVHIFLGVGFIGWGLGIVRAKLFRVK